MRKLFLLFALAVGLLASASTQAQTILTVKNGAAIRLNFIGDQRYTTFVRIISGSTDTTIEVKKDWYNSNFPSTFTVTAGDSTMTIYGEPRGFYCGDNGTNLTAIDLSNYTRLEWLQCYNNNLTSLDLSHNTNLDILWCYNNQLTSLDLSHNRGLDELSCYGNNFTNATLDYIYCSLPDRTRGRSGVIYPVYDSSDPNLATVLATNKQNATSKNWNVKYFQGNTYIPATTGTYVCGTQHTEPNMSRYITLTVKNGEDIKLRFKAAADDTPLRVVSGSFISNNIYSDNWSSTVLFPADGTTMTVYGDIIGFDCSDNGANLTALDLSHNTRLTDLYCFSNLLTSLDVSQNTHLEKLYCYGNPFNTAALDDIYCSLPDRTGTTYGVIEPIYNSSSWNRAIVLATNKQNATSKNWKVKYYQGDTDIPATTGIYVCGTPHPEPNMSRYITLTVRNVAQIKLDFKAATNGTPVRIVSGGNTEDIIVGTSWYGTDAYIADGTTMTIYGNLTGFDCSGNQADLIALDPSHNTQLEMLYCKNNSINSLDVSENTQLIGLDCAENQLYSLDVSNNTQLMDLYCSYNYLSSLNVSNNMQLEELQCSSNRLTTLDISQNTRLKNLSCHGNDFTTAVLDRIYCALPVRSASDGARIFPLGESSSVAEQNMVASTSGANAIAKNWRVLKYKEDGTHTDIATTGSYVCPEPNMSSYIILTVAKDSAITLDFQAAAEGTTIRIVSGGRARDITVGTSLYGNTYTAYGTEMKIYGDLTGFVCSGNRGNLTALDPSHNTQLKWLSCSDNNLTSLDLSHNTQLEKLYCNKNQLTSLDLSHNTQLKQLFCYGNGFSTQALDDIYCALPLRQASDLAVIYPIYSASSSDHATVIATNAYNATDKNWMVKYYQDGTDISTTGSYVCPAPTMDSYITLTVKSGENITLNFKAAAEGTPVRIVRGGRTSYITVGTSLYGSTYFTAYGTEMKVYGNLTGFYCSGNRGKITALDPSHNTQLKWLDCSYNQLSSLDVSHNTQLEQLYCDKNQLTSLDLSHNTQLKQLFCKGNGFSSQALDDIYCTLPLRQASDHAVIYPIYSASSSYNDTVVATNAQNATDKNWKVLYYDGDTDIPATTGTYTCPATDIAEASAEPSLTLYPNPVADVLYLSATARTIRIYNVYGIEVAHATDTDRVDVAHLPAGVYMVKADGTVAKMVKR